MSRQLYRFYFPQKTAIENVKAAMVLALFATESLHGRVRTRLDAAQYIDAVQKACVVDASTVVGKDLARLFAGFAIREFGQQGFDVERIEKPAKQTDSAAINFSPKPA